MSQTLQVCSKCLLFNVQIEARVIKLSTLIFTSCMQETLEKKYQEVVCFLHYIIHFIRKWDDV